VPWEYLPAPGLAAIAAVLAGAAAAIALKRARLGTILREE
jgi:hypothetical protein